MLFFCSSVPLYLPLCWAVLLVCFTNGDSDVDWLVEKPVTVSYVREDCWSDGICGLEIGNGLVARRFALAPSFGTVDYIANKTASRGGEQSMFRAVMPEGFVTLNNVEYKIGGLQQTDTFRAYTNRTSLKSVLIANHSNAFQYISHAVSEPVAPFAWTPGSRHSPTEFEWPPKGKTLSVTFKLENKGQYISEKLSGLELVVFYEIYDGVPLLNKWIEISCSSCCSHAHPHPRTSSRTVHTHSHTPDVIVNKIVVEQLGLMPEFGGYLLHGSSPPGADGEGAASTYPPNPLLHVKTDQAHGASCRWLDDQKNSYSPSSGGDETDHGAGEPFLNCNYTIGPGAHVSSDESFVSFRVFELAMDSLDVERQQLQRHRFTQLLAPHTTENPIFFHATDVSEAGFKKAVDQMKEVGFEMLIFSFGTDFKLETADPIYLARIKRQIEYANANGIEVSGYDLICLDRGHGGYGGNVGDEWVAVKDDGSLGLDACFASGWYDKLHELILNFINTTGLSGLETDGPYGGGTCAATNHSHHHGEDDSVYRQTQLQNQFYKQMRKLGVYVNQPDNFFFQGGSRTGMGYDEKQYSLPRWQDLSISRMGMYDDLYRLLPTQGWMFLPLSDYEGGGSGAAFQGHVQEYSFGLQQYLGAGTAACYRGPCPYSSNASKAMLIEHIGFYQKHRYTLTQPVIHLRRPNMQGWDGWLHVNPFSYGSTTNFTNSSYAAVGEREVGVAVIFNPTTFALAVKIALPLYYCGVGDAPTVQMYFDGKPGAAQTIKVERDYSAVVQLSLSPKSAQRVVITLDL
jgi:hypothetical protein